MTRYRGSIHIDDVRDGKNGRDAVTLVVTPPTISVDTKADGTVDESCLTDAKATVKAYAGGKPLKLTITSVEKSAGIDAEAGYADNFRTVAGVKIKAIDADATGYAMASGSVTIGLSVYVDGAEQRLTAVIGVVTTLHKVTAEIAKDNVSVTHKVTELTRTVNGNQTTTEAALSTLNGAIAGKVSRTDYNADKRAQSQRETEIRQSVEDITLTVKNRGNILRGTGFRNQRTLPELTGGAVWSDKPEDLYGSHGVIHVPMSTETTARYAGMGFLVPLKELVSGRKYTLSCAVLVKDPASLSRVYTDMYYLKNDKTRLGAVGDGAQWKPQDFAAGSWRRVQVTFTPDFTDKPEAQYIIMYIAVLDKGEAWFAEPQLEVGTVATPWAPNVNDADENLQDTALEIKNRKIVATADNFVFKNNKGEETAAITEDGKLNTNVVDAKTIVAEGVRAQTIDAGNAKFKNLEVVDGKFSGTLKGVRGSFESLECINDEGIIVGRIAFGENGTISISGDMYHQGMKDGRPLRFYTNNLWCRGSFGAAMRNTIVVQGAIVKYYVNNVSNDAVSVPLQSQKATDGKTIYYVPCYGVGEYISGFPVDTVLFDTVEDEDYYYILGMIPTQRCMVANINDRKGNVYIFSNGYAIKFNGGALGEAVRIPPQFMSPSLPDERLGRGVLVSEIRDNNW